MFTNLVLYSGSSHSNLAGGVYLKYFSNNETFRAHVGLHINYQATGDDIMETGGHIENYTVTLTPYRWYRVSIIVDKVSEQLQLFLDQEFVAQLPFDKNLFKTFNNISIWGWIP